MGGDVKIQHNAAHEILELLAKELPKIVKGPSNAPKPQTIPSREERQSQKRKRVHLDENDNWRFDFAESIALDPSLSEEIIAAYFNHVQPWIPMIHEGRFRGRLEYEDDRARLVVVIQAMAIAASRYAPNASIPASTIAQIRSGVITTAMDNLCLESLQALIIVAYTDVSIH